MNVESRHERGQAIVLLVVSLVVLMGLAALAVDGGMVLSDRRHAQNATDAAALAAALQKANNQSLTVIENAAKSSVASNGFDPSEITITLQNLSDWSGSYSLVTVALTTTTETSLVGPLFGGNEMTNRVSATARVRTSQPALPGTAIMAMGDCSTEGASLVGFTGGGHSAAIRAFEGGIFLNSPETAASYCAIDLPVSQGSDGVYVDEGHDILSVGAYDYTTLPPQQADKIIPLPVITGINGGSPIDDPIAHLPEPQCTADGSQDPVTGHYLPGRYSTIPTGVLDPGIYCVNGDVREAGQRSIDATSGVVIYMQSGEISITGNGDFLVNAPTTANCTGTAGDPTASCTYVGIAIFMARNNTDKIELAGNGEYRVQGLVYHINGTVEARGGGFAAYDYVVRGQVIARRLRSTGQSDFTVTYDAGYTYWNPPFISLER